MSGNQTISNYIDSLVREAHRRGISVRIGIQENPSVNNAEGQSTYQNTTTTDIQSILNLYPDPSLESLHMSDLGLSSPAGSPTTRSVADVSEDGKEGTFDLAVQMETDDTTGVSRVNSDEGHEGNGAWGGTGSVDARNLKTQMVLKEDEDMSPDSHSHIDNAFETALSCYAETASRLANDLLSQPLTLLQLPMVQQVLAKGERIQRLALIKDKWFSYYPVWLSRVKLVLAELKKMSKARASSDTDSQDTSGMDQQSDSTESPVQSSAITRAGYLGTPRMLKQNPDGTMDTDSPLNLREYYSTLAVEAHDLSEYLVISRKRSRHNTNEDETSGDRKRLKPLRM